LTTAQTTLLFWNVGTMEVPKDLLDHWEKAFEECLTKSIKIADTLFTEDMKIS
jgi:ferredoxin